MEIKSDKENVKNPGVFTKVWKYFTEDFWKTILILILPVALYGWFTLFPEDYVWLIFSAVGGAFGIGLLTNGELFKDIKALIFIFLMILGLVTGLWFITSAQESEIDTIDLKPFITEVKSNKDKNAFIINNKLPFESGIEVSFSQRHQYDALFVNPEYFKDFAIVAQKTCNSYRIKSISCDVIVKITHKDSGEDLFVKTLYNSVYPKKLKLEDEVE